MIRGVFYTNFFLGILYSCTRENKSSDFTSLNTFTEGIESPATDIEGNIYAVNYKKEGTVGKITPDGEASLFIKLPNSSIGNGIRFGKKRRNVYS